MSRIFNVRKFYRTRTICIITSTTSTRRLQTSAKAADPAKFYYYIPLFCSGKNSVKKFLDPGKGKAKGAYT